MPLSFFRETVTVIRAPLIIKNGQQTRDWTNASSHSVTNVQITAQATTREFDGRVTNVTDRRLFRGPYDADIEPGDRIVWNGDTYEIDGEVFHSPSPTGRISSTRCTLVRWEG